MKRLFYLLLLIGLTFGLYSQAPGTLRIYLPDLEIKDFYLAPRSCTLYVSIKNNGRSLINTWVELKIQSQVERPILNSQNWKRYNLEESIKIMLDLKRGEQKTFSLGLQKGLFGRNIVSTVTVDPSNKIIELNEKNNQLRKNLGNCGAFVFRVKRLRGSTSKYYYDIGVSQIQVIDPGDSLSIDICNYGTKDIAGKYKLEVRLGGKIVYNNDVFLNLKSPPSNKLNLTKENCTSYLVKLPNVICGAVPVQAFIDADNRLKERDEQNNRFTSLVENFPYDLGVVDIWKGVAGTIFVKIKNNSKVKVFKNKYTIRWWTSGAVVASEKQVSLLLNPGEEESFELFRGINIPGYVERIKVEIDPNNDLKELELNRKNNIMEKTIVY